MQISLGAVLTLSIKYHYQRGKLHYYQRKIPLDVAHHYDGQVHIKVNLETNELRFIPQKIIALNKRYEAEWSALRNNLSITPTTIRAEALSLLNSYNLKPNPGINNEYDLDHLHKVFEAKAITYVDGDEHELLNLVPSEFLGNVEVEALRLLKEKPQLRLSDALKIYLDTHKNKYVVKFVTFQTRGWNKLISAVGDKPFIELVRADARMLVDYMLGTGVKTTTAARNLNIASAVFNEVCREKEIELKNPFTGVKIGGYGDDSIERVSFSAEQLSLLKAKCFEIDDDVRWLLALQADLGCRIGEAVGLALHDLHLDAEIPYVTFKPHPWRRLKTKCSARDIPLLGSALWAAHRIVDTATKGQLYAFPRYTDGKTCKADGASATCNKFIRKLGIEKTTHELRHAMRDRLRNVDASKSLQDAVGGWGREGDGDEYGKGFTPKTLKRWMDKVV